MADVAILELTKGVAYDSVLISGMSTAAATQQIPCEYGKDHRLMLIVYNSDISECTVTVSAATDGGFRKELGNYVHTVPASTFYVINLADTSRYKDLSDNDIDVAVSTGGTIGNINLLAVQG